jgi:peptidoglycan hydrolase-like protein with peptidoglycan-binding domain
MTKITQVLKFNEFERLYESYNFINEAEEALFTPDNLTVSPEELAADLSAGATGSEKAKPVEEALEPNAFSPIKIGEKSDRVKQLQKDLKLSTQDGIFGKGTESSVKEFQKNNKLAVDGKVGVQTLRKILELNGDKDVDSTITRKYRATAIKNADQAKAANIDPQLLELFDVTLMSNGTEQYVILIPKKDAATKAKAIQKSKFEVPAWFKTILLALTTGGVPGALIVTSIGITSATLVAAKAMISAIGSSVKFLAGSVAYTIGAVVQGLQTIASWYAKAGKAVYAKISNTFNELFTRFNNGFASVAKASMKAITAYMQALQVGGLVLTGLALKAFKAVASKLAAPIKALVDGAKDAAAFIKAATEKIASEGAQAIATFKKEVQEGWTTVKNTTQKAWNGAKTAVKSTGEAVANAAQQAYTETADFLTSCYEDGLKFWESLEETDGDYIFESAYSFNNFDFSL